MLRQFVNTKQHSGNTSIRVQVFDKSCFVHEAMSADLWIQSLQEADSARAASSEETRKPSRRFNVTACFCTPNRSFKFCVFFDREEQASVQLIDLSPRTGKAVSKWATAYDYKL